MIKINGAYEICRTEYKLFTFHKTCKILLTELNDLITSAKIVNFVLYKK